MIRRQRLRLELSGVGTGRRVTAASLLAVAAEVFLEVFLLAVGRSAVAAQVATAAVNTKNCLGDHDQSIL